MGVRFRRPVALMVGITILAVPTLLFADPGFGTLRRKVMDLRTRRPALVRLANTSLALRSNASDPQYQNALASLVATLETELLSNEKTLVKKPEGQAEWTLALTITGFQVPQPTTRTERSGNTSRTIRRWTGTMNVAYQVVDQGGRIHDADNVAASYDKEVDANASAPSGIPGIRIPGLGGGQNETPDPRSQEDVKQLLIRDVVRQVAANLGNTAQVIEARIAGGDPALDRAGDFMSKQLWSRAVEELEKKAAFAKPEDESYRQYSLGLAYEAMSYDAKVFNEQRANLFKAQEYYDRAAELNPGQRYFIDVVARTKDSVARYRTLEAMSKEDRSKQQLPDTKARSADVASPAAPVSATKRAALTIDDVIKMHAAQVSSADIIRLINDSDMSFALDVDTLIKLSNAKLPMDVENAMRAKSGHPLRAAGPSTGRGRGAPAGATPASGTAPVAPKR